MSALEITALVSGLVFLGLEIIHSKWLWPAQMISCAAMLFVYLPDRLWGMSAMQLYYLIMSVVGIVSWKKDSERDDSQSMPLNRPDRVTMGVSACLLVFGGAVCSWIMVRTGDPAPVLDAVVTMLNIIGTWWLVRSYAEQWLIWILADSICIVLFMNQRLFGPMCLYAVYSVSSVAGYFNWKRKGTIIGNR